jgi:radical SAM superfamily enzyme YgiQ (UPF0313 family)
MPWYETRVYDCHVSGLEGLSVALSEFSPDYIGLSLRNIDDVNFYNQESFTRDYMEIMEIIRKSVACPVITGGSAFSIFPEELYRQLEPDYGITGEGEESLCRLLQSLDNGKPDLSIDGLVYETAGIIRVNTRKNFVRKPELGFSPELLPYYWDKAGMVNIQTKRGCPYHCIYCSYPIIDGSRVRTLDPDQIVQTLEKLYFEHKISYVFFTDSVFNIENQFNEELSRKIIEKKLQISWGAYFSPHHLTLQQLQLFASAGLTHIEFGTESLSDTTLNCYGKQFTVDDVVRISDYCNQAGIYFSHFLILGGYGETPATLSETFENSKRISNTVFFPFLGMRVYPGTLLHKKLIADGILLENDSLLAPFYYLAPEIDYSTIKAKAELTGRRWVFPDEDLTPVLIKMRQRNRKGTLWHHLRQ